MSKKVFKKREDIEEVGLLLKIANAALTRACTKVSNNIGNSNTVTKSLNKLINKRVYIPRLFSYGEK